MGYVLINRLANQHTNLLTDLLTKLSRAFLVLVKKISISFWNAKFPYCLLKIPLLDKVLSHMNPFHTLAVYFLAFRFFRSKFCMDWSYNK